MDYDALSEIKVVAIPIDSNSREKIKARLMILWQKVKPDDARICLVRETAISMIASAVDLKLVDGKLVVSIPPAMDSAYSVLKHGSLYHKELPNIDAEILNAASS